MNYYEEISKMLGVELDEEFKLSFTKKFVYKITLDGLMVRQLGEFKWCKSIPVTLTKLFKGEYSIVKLPWKPEMGKTYWHYSITSEQALWTKWCSDSLDLCRWKACNCFRTKEEADTKGKEVMEQIMKEFGES